jgi:hypothetical protein
MLDDAREERCARRGQSNLLAAVDEPFHEAVASDGAVDQIALAIRERDEQQPLLRIERDDAFDIERRRFPRPHRDYPHDANALARAPKCLASGGAQRTSRTRGRE